MMMKMFKLKIHYCIFYRITIFIQNFLIIKFLTEKYEENYEGDFFKNVLNVDVCEFIQNLTTYKYIYIIHIQNIIITSFFKLYYNIKV